MLARMHLSAKKKKKKKERRRKNLAVMAKTAKSENFSLLLQRKIRTILAAFTRITKSGEKRKKKKLEQMHQRDEEEEKEREKKKLNRKYKNNVHASALSMK